MATLLTAPRSKPEVTDEVQHAMTTSSEVVHYGQSHPFEVMGEHGKVTIGTEEALGLAREVRERLIAAKLFETEGFDEADARVFATRAFIAARGHELMKPEVVKDAWLLTGGQQFTDEAWFGLIRIPGIQGELSAWALLGKDEDGVPKVDLEVFLVRVHKMNLAGMDPTKTAADVQREREVSAEVERLKQEELDHAYKAETIRLAREQLGLNDELSETRQTDIRPTAKRAIAIKEILAASTEQMSIQDIIAALKGRGIATSRPSVAADIQPLAAELTAERAAHGRKVYRLVTERTADMRKA